jgi:hypothetical protein
MENGHSSPRSQEPERDKSSSYHFILSPYDPLQYYIPPTFMSSYWSLLIGRASKLLPVLVSTVIFGFEHRGTHDHVFFFKLVGWDFGYCGHYWPIVPAPDDRWWWLWRNWRNEDWQEKPKYSEKTCTQRHFVHDTFHMTRPRFEPRPPRWEVREPLELWRGLWPCITVSRLWHSHRNIFAFLFPLVCYMPCPYRPPWFNHSDYTWRRVQVMKLLVLQFSPTLLWLHTSSVGIFSTPPFSNKTA